MAHENTYWNRKGIYPEAVEKLQALIPARGSVANPYKNEALERFRKAMNAYYRLYNDGDFNSGKGRMFGIKYISHFRTRKFYTDHNGRLQSYGCWAQELYDEVEVGINKIIEAAAKEQGIELK